MKVPARYCKLISILLFILSDQTSPQANIPEKIQFKHLTKENGLSGNSIWCVLKDKKGFIWIGTHEGLNRYDGIKFRVFKYDVNNPNSLSGNEVTALCEDRSGNLWVGTSGGLNKYNGEQENFSRYIYPVDSSSNANYIRSLCEDNLGNIWLGTHHGGLYRFDPESEEFIRYKNILGDTTSLSYNYIWSLKEDSKSNLWIGTAGGGLNKFNPKNQTFTKYQYNPNHPNGLTNDIISGICEDKSGAIWLATYGGGICKLTFRPDNSPLFTNYKYDPNNYYGLSDASIDGMYIDKNNMLWFGTGKGGLNRTKSYLGYNSSLQFITYKHNPYDPTSISGNVIPHIYEDNSGLMWIATIGDGLNIFDKKQKQFRQYKHDPVNPFSLSGNDVLVMYEDRSGTIWISTRRDGLNKWDRTTNNFIHYKNVPNDPNSLSDNRIYSIYEDRKGILWLGTYSGGLNRFDRKTGKFFTYKNNPSNRRSISGNGVFSIVEDKSGILWIGTLDNGINKFDRESDSFHNINYNPDSLNIFKSVLYASIQLVDNSGTLWIGDKTGGVIVYDTEKDKMISYKHNPNNSNSLSSNIISFVYEDKSGTFWFGTDGGGLTRFERGNNRFTRYNAKNGLPSNIIFDILEDESGNLWISTDNGLSRFDPKEEKFTNYDAEDGLLSNEFERYTKSCKTKENELIFSNGNGFIIFHPDSIKDNTEIPPVYITDFYLFNKPVQIGYDSVSERTVLSKSIIECNEIELNLDDNVFSFEFAALNFHAPDKNKYAYIMEGFDKDWTYTDASRNIATYTNLNPGEYIFRVKGSNNDGYWNEKGASIKVIILPPWWRTNIAYLIYFLLIGSIIYFTWRAQVKRIRNKHKYEISELETRKLHEVNEIKSRFFANISHEFRTPLTLILGPAKKLLESLKDEKVKEDLSLIHRSAKKLNKLVDELLDISRIEAGEMKLKVSPQNLVSLTKEILLQFYSFAERKNITLNFSCDSNEITAYLDRDKFDKILNNILSNAFKFTPEGGTVEIEIKASPKSPPKEGTFKSVLSPPLEGRGVGSSGFVEISIRDTGIGIPQDQLDKIFDRFYQVDASRTREHEGTGIGLSLTKELVELHKGIITVESSAGKGSTFRIIFPLGKDHLKAEEITTASIERERFEIDEDIPLEHSLKNKMDADLLEHHEKPSLLIVEDNADVRKYLYGILKNEYIIMESEDGEDGLRKSFEHIPDLIISDIMMPKLDGFQLCNQLKNDSRTSHIPIIILTAKATIDDKINGLKIGADDYIIKPFEAAELHARIKNLLAQRERLHDHFRKYGLVEIETQSISSFDQKFVQKAIEVINKNLSNTNYGIETLASDLAVSKWVLNKKLSALTGETPAEFIKRIRLCRAAKLIEHSTGNISEIALEVGFNNPAYFAECFKKQLGISPSQYHQNRRTN